MDPAMAGPPREATKATRSLKVLLRDASRSTFSAAVLSASIASSLSQAPPAPSIDDESPREYVGTYEWGPDHFVYLQMWSEFTGKNDLVAFDESGEVRTLFPVDKGQFIAGPGAAAPNPIESRIEFSLDITGLTSTQPSLSTRSQRANPMTRRLGAFGL